MAPIHEMLPIQATYDSCTAGFERRIVDHEKRNLQTLQNDR